MVRILIKHAKTEYLHCSMSNSSIRQSLIVILYIVDKYNRIYLRFAFEQCFWKEINRSCGSRDASRDFVNQRELSPARTQDCKYLPTYSIYILISKCSILNLYS